MKKRWLLFVVLLCACMVTFIAFSISAEQYEGTLGDNLTWIFDSDTGVLTISGEGKMRTARTWQGHEKLRHVVIQEGVTSIADEMFMDCVNLTSVEIPETVTSIGTRAFRFSGLETVYLHDGITYIGTSAFEYTKLKSVKIPSGITEISFGAFRGCKNLAQVELHGGITKIDNEAFASCEALTQIHIPEGVQIIFGAFHWCANLRSITIPDSVTYIAGSFDGCTSLEEVILGNGLVEAGNFTFRDCKSLKNIVLPEKVQVIGDSAFSGCDALETLTAGSALKTIHQDAFHDCGKLYHFDISKDNPYLFSEDGVIYQRDPFTLVRIPPAYKGKLKVLDGVTKVEWYAGFGCESITEIVLPDTVTEISHHAFDGCKNLVSIQMPAELVLINGQAFYECEKLQSIVIPGKVERIESLAFSGCTGLKKITFLCKMPYIASGAFAHVAAEAYYTEGDPTWKDGWNDYISNLTWPQNGPDDPNSGKCGENAYWHFDPETGTMTISGTGPMTDTQGWYNSDLDASIYHLVVEDGITYIGYGACNTMRQLQTVKLAKSVTHIGGEAFRLCPITSIDLHEGITQIDEGAFMDTGLVSVKLPSTLRTIDYQVFLGCQDLRQVIIPEGVTAIEHGAFKGCIALENVTIADSVQEIWEFAFARCFGLKQVKLGCGLTQISSYAFSDCAFAEIRIPASVRKIGENAFGYCVNLVDVYFEGDVPEMDAPFAEVTATAYYPGANDTWTSDALKQYGGVLTWKPNCSPEHNFGEWVKIQEPTLEKEGLAERQCVHCGYKEQRELPKLQPTVPPTDPTESSTQPTQPPTEPTEPAIEPTQLPTQPTVPTVQATEQPTQPTESTGNPQLDDTPDGLVIAICAVAVLLVGAIVAIPILKRKK